MPSLRNEEDDGQSGKYRENEGEVHCLAPTQRDGPLMLFAAGGNVEESRPERSLPHEKRCQTACCKGAGEDNEPGKEHSIFLSGFRLP